MVYEAFLPKDKWVEYKAREYVTNPRYGQLYEVRKEKPRPKPKEQSANWLWEQEFRLWRLEITKLVVKEHRLFCRFLCFHFFNEIALV